jgi:isopentenyldiphosphate isomerase
MSQDEIVVLVDEADNISGYKKRSELALEDRWRIIAIWIENSKGEVLLAQRSDNVKNDPGCWGPATAGTVNKDQSYEECAYKELAEELGLTDVRLTPHIKAVYISTRGNRRVCQWFTAKVDLDANELNLQPEEVQAAKWFNKEELLHEIEDHPDKFVGSAPLWKDWIKF